MRQLSRTSLAELDCRYLAAEGDQMPAHWEHEVWSDGHGVLLSVSLGILNFSGPTVIELLDSNGSILSWLVLFVVLC